MQVGPQLQNRAIPGYEPEQIPAGASHSNFTPPANTGLGFLDAIADETILAMADLDDADGDGISGVPNWSYIPITCNCEKMQLKEMEIYLPLW